jgi:glycyl-tRNA synthetase beta chain
VLGLQSGRTTAGHRFLGRKTIALKHASDYVKSLRDLGKVLAGFEARCHAIEQQVRRLERKLRVSAITSSGELADFSGDARLGDIAACHRALLTAREELLPEVTALVEFPVTYVGKFDQSFLDLPMECLTLSMRQHQRYFPCFDQNGRLMPTFLIVSNLDTTEPRQIVHGNERVLRARLADAKFFYDQDRKTRLEDRVQRLASVVYHGKLGSQLQRVERLRLLAGIIARRLDTEDRHAERAAWLSKADLSTEMVGEFPELQGIMGRQYALHDGEPKEVAQAIGQHYQPRFAGDTLPHGGVACAVALADKLDALAGLFGVGQQPTGEKDPFGLRRAALGVVRILVERRLPLSLPELVKPDVYTFILERFAGYLKDQGYSTLQVDSVLSQSPPRLDLVPQQLEAVKAFQSLPEAESLAAANKRVANILRQAQAKGESFGIPERKALKEAAEISLFDALQKATSSANQCYERGDYAGYLKTFAVLKAPVDTFFDKVMVMDEQKALRQNRLALLADLCKAMNRVADISKLAQ